MYVQFLLSEFQESKNIESFQLWVNISVLQSINYAYNHKLRMPIIVQWECRINDEKPRLTICSVKEGNSCPIHFHTCTVQYLVQNKVQYT